MEKELLRKLGEETIYSAKSHYKSCDIRRICITNVIWMSTALNIFGVMGIYPTVDKLLSAIGLFCCIALLIWNEGEGKDYRVRHKAAGETYLALHKKIRAEFMLHQTDSETVRLLNQEVSEFDKSQKPDISWLARKWAQLAISSGKETDNWFIK